MAADGAGARAVTPGWWPRGVGRVQLRAPRAHPQRSLAASASPCRAAFRSGEVSGDLSATFPGSVSPPSSPSPPRYQLPDQSDEPLPHPRFSQVRSWVLAKNLGQGCAEPQQSPSRHRLGAPPALSRHGAGGHEGPRAEGWVLSPHLVASWSPWPLGSGEPGFPSSSEAPW